MVYVKLPVNDRTDPGEVTRAIDLVAKNAPNAPVFLQPIAFPGSALSLSREKLDLFFDTARRRIEVVRVLPQIHPILGPEFK